MTGTPYLCNFKMRKFAIILFLMAFAAGPIKAQKHSFSGRVLEKATGEPVEFAIVLINATEQWSVTDHEGRFSIDNIKTPKSTVTISCLGYVTLTRELKFAQDISNAKFQLEIDNLTLSGAVVTAKENDAAATTSRTIDKTALEHVQVMNVGDVASLLPGGATVDNNLVTSRQFNIRAGAASENGNASFGTAVEVDGMRLSNNASYGDVKGVSTNSIASANVESVEVISGVPSVEYGDIGAGIVKINTKKGKTPWMITLSTSPRTKQVSFSKGLGLGETAGGKSRGVLNISAEYTRSVSDVMSPYTSYDRKQLSLSYSNTFSQGLFAGKPLRFSAGVTGNLGGLDNKADPDKLVGTFSTARDNTLRGNLSANWLLSLPWITNVELNASAGFSDKRSRENKNYTYSVSSTALHALKEGYYISAPYVEGGDNPAVLIAPGSRYNVLAIDDRPVTAKVSLKANWAAHLGKASNKVKLGADWNYDYNLGTGQYSEDEATSPTYRVYRYCDNPAMHNLGVFLEDNLSLPVGQGHLNLIAGLRSDNTFIKGSAYGSTSSLSPRFNAKYTVLDPRKRSNRTLRELAFRASWGVAVKLPSFHVLYPTPSYLDIDVFSSTASQGTNTVYMGYYVLPRSLEYNPSLRWQRNQQGEVGVDANIAGTRISLAAFYNRTLDSYYTSETYSGFRYTYTGLESTQSIGIPSENRIYVINPVSGAVTARDKTGALPDQTLSGEPRQRFTHSTRPDNAGYTTSRWGLEWVIDFPRIEAIGTTVRLDGNYYHYKSINTDMMAYTSLSEMGVDGRPYKYVGYYSGGRNVANGNLSRNLRNNLTITTHIPKVRMIISLKLEASLLRYSLALSEIDGAERARVMADRSKLLELLPDQSIYSGNNFTVVFPEYYESIEQPGVQVPYLEKLRWAKANDPALYNDLARLAVTSNYLYIFNEDYISPYFCANFSITKELGDIASLSFYANNFFNNMGQVFSTKTGNYSSVSSYIPSFYYGLTLRLKF